MNFYRCCIILVLLGGGVGCIQTQNSSSQDLKLYGVLPAGTPEYLAAQEVLSQSCVPCHDFHGYTSDELVSSGLVIADNAENSPLYYRLSGSAGSNGAKNMPPSGALTTADINKIKAFIDSL